MMTPSVLKGAELPGPRATPLLGARGSYIRFIADQLRWLEQLKGYGPLVALARGNPRYLFLFHPD